MGYRYNAITGDMDFVDTETVPPAVPTIFTADAGNATPALNILDILGTNGITTSGAGNTITITAATATSGATALLATKGVASFDSADFTVVDGFVKVAATFGGIQSILTDDGLPAVDPDAAGQVNFLGTNGLVVNGHGPGNTVTVTGLNSTAIATGVVELCTDAEVIDGTQTDYHVVNPSSLKAKLGVQTAQGVMISKGTNAAIESTAAGTTGQLLVGGTGANPAFANIAYNSGFTFSNLTAANPVTLSVNNTDTDIASTANLLISVPPLGADGFVSWEIQGTLFYAMGPDNSDSDIWKLTTSSDPSSGTTAIAVDNTTAAVKFANAYEFPIADGTANYVLATDGAGNLDFAEAGTLVTDHDNILYVGKHGSDANDGRTPSNAKLTIQAAVTAAAEGDTILVYPGSYNETVTHAANNVTMIAEGKTNSVIITQADANVVDFATFTGIQYKYFGIKCTAATTAINTVQGSTGGCTFKECYLEMKCATDIAAAIQPAVGSITGAGDLKITIGRVNYSHTGNGGGTAQKGAFRVADGGEVTLQRINDLSIACSGTALVTGVAIDTASTGVFFMNDNKITVTDPNATIVTGLAYLGGTGLTHEYFRNEVHVIATNNIGYGFFSADTATKSRFFFNHIHVEDTAGSSYSFLIGNGATVTSRFDDIVAADGYSLTAGGIFCQTNSEVDGELTCSCAKAADTNQVTIANTDNTATASNAAVNISVGGTTSTGDPYTQWLITGSTAFSAGIDNSDSDAFKIGPNTNPSTGNSDFEIAAATGAITFNEAYTFPVADGGADEVLTTDGAGAVTWQAAGAGGLTWSVVTADTDFAVNTGTIANKAGLLTMTLPATAAIGDIIEITGINTAVGWRVAQNANQTCHFGTSSTTTGVGGYLEATAIRDSVKLVCVVAGASTEYNVLSSVGNITVS